MYLYLYLTADFIGLSKYNIIILFYILAFFIRLLLTAYIIKKLYVEKLLKENIENKAPN